MCACLCVYVHFDWTITRKKGNTLRRPWDKRLTHCKTCPMAWLRELWINQRLWNFMSSLKRSNKDDFLSVPLRLNTCLHWTIWPIPRGVQCKHVSLYAWIYSLSGKLCWCGPCISLCSWTIFVCGTSTLLSIDVPLVNAMFFLK